MGKKKIIIGTRGSNLALYQANKVKAELEEKHDSYEFEIKIIKTKGDKILDVALSKIGDKGLFTKEIEQELLDGTIDLAVHSLKDLPTVLPEKLALGGVLKRAEFRDALVSIGNKKLSELKAGDKIATSSLRRKAQLLKINPDFDIVDIRGNVETRLNKMKSGYCDAMIMAAAGLQRLGYDEEIAEVLDEEMFIPAVSQGAIAIEIRENDEITQSVIDKICCQNTLKSVKAERVFLNTLEGGCQVPVGCYTKINNGEFSITGFVSGINGEEMIKDKMTGNESEAENIAKKLADSFFDRGAKRILDKVRES